jgi:hypothetical protein
MAAAGVITRFWSSASATAGRMPGVTSTMPGPRFGRSSSASTAEQTTPSTPMSRA